MIFPIAERSDETMKMRISIQCLSTCDPDHGKGVRAWHPLEIDGEERTITGVDIRDGRWYSGDHRFTRRQQEQLTQRAKTIIENDRRPRVLLTISIRECQKAIEIAGGIKITFRGEDRLITEVRTGGGGNTRWFSGGLHFTLSEQERLTRLARAIINQERKTKRQLPLPYLE